MVFNAPHFVANFGNSAHKSGCSCKDLVRLNRMVDQQTEIVYSPLGEAEEKSCFYRFKKTWLRMDKLIWWTLLGVGVGTALGAALFNAGLSARAVELIGYPGELLIRALEELVLPLIAFALMTGVLNLRHSSGGTGRITGWALLYYLMSMFLAVGLGIGLVFALKPGRGEPFSGDGATDCSLKKAGYVGASEDSSSADGSTVDSLLNIGRNLIPTNIVAAAAEPNYLGVILFSIVFAFALTTIGERAEPLIRVIEVLNDVILKIIFAVIVTTPVGVASLIASTILKACSLLHLLNGLSLYVGTVFAGLVIHTVVILPITVFLLSRENPLKIFWSFMPALVMGLGTSSSAATMPLTMQCGEEHGCEPSIVKFVIPLGTNINRDGSALYEAVSVMFIIQAHGHSLSAGNLFVIAITSTLAAIGCASIPNAALVTMITVLQALGYSQYIGDISILYAVDWFLGMLRTSVNIWGDACACVVVNTWAKQFSERKEKLPTSSPELVGII